MKGIPSDFYYHFAIAWCMVISMDNEEKKDIFGNEETAFDKSEEPTPDFDEPSEADYLEQEVFEPNEPVQAEVDTKTEGNSYNPVNQGYPNGYSNQQNGYSNQSAGYPNQQGGYPNQPQMPQQPQQQPPQSQWSFNNYGPLGGNDGQGQPLPPKPKKEKKPKSPNFGVKVFAIVMSVLFVLSAGGFSIVLLTDLDKSPIVGGQTSSQDENSGKLPSLDISNTPDKPTGDVNGDGTLSTKEIYNKVAPSVVGIAVYVKQYGEVKQGEGSGVIIDKNGYIVTNYHVVASDAQNPIVKIEVIMPSGETYVAETVGGDVKTDLAVIKITADNLVPAEFGDSDKLSIGDRVVVIGNPSGVQFAGSLTQGVVSALNRSVYMSDLQAQMQYIQTDAAINPGNSGGAFINEFGQVVGISSAKMSVDAGYEGMGFAIPINSAKSVIDSLIQNGYVAGRPRIGIQYKAVAQTLAELNGIPAGLRVVVVEEGYDAYGKGVTAGDIITKMDGKEVYDSETTSAVLKDKKPGDQIVLTIYRVNESGRSSTLEISVILGEDTSQKPKE